MYKEIATGIIGIAAGLYIGSYDPDVYNVDVNFAHSNNNISYKSKGGSGRPSNWGTWVPRFSNKGLSRKQAAEFKPDSLSEKQKNIIDNYKLTLKDVIEVISIYDIYHCKTTFDKDFYEKYGAIYKPPEFPYREIIINNNFDKDEVQDTSIHEILHASFELKEIVFNEDSDKNAIEEEIVIIQMTPRIYTELYEANKDRQK